MFSEVQKLCVQLYDGLSLCWIEWRRQSKGHVCVHQWPCVGVSVETLECEIPLRERERRLLGDGCYLVCTEAHRQPEEQRAPARG